MWHPVRFLKRRRRSPDDFAREIAAHLALEAERLVAEGRSPQDAAHEAHRRFGNVGLAREDFSRRRSAGWLERAPQHVRLAARRLLRAPLFSLTVALTLALGIGATSAVFSLVNAVLLRPLAFPHPEQLTDLSHTLMVHGVTHVDQSDATYLFYRMRSRDFTDMGAYQRATVNLETPAIGDAQNAERVEGARVTPSMFSTLQVAPLMGSVFRSDEGRVGAAPTVMLGERLWRQRFGADPRIIGQTVTVDGVGRAVVGIMPARFDFPDSRTALWLPLVLDPATTHAATFDLRAVGRLRSGILPAAAETELLALLPHVPDAFPGRLTAPAIAATHMRPLVRGLRDTIVGSAERTIWVVFGAAAFLLLVAFASVADLFLARSVAQQRDLMVRRALGASRGAILAESLAEGLLLATLGCAFGLGLAQAALVMLRTTEPGIAIPRLDGMHLDGTVLLLAAGLSGLIALAMSAVPVVQASGAGLAAALAQAGRGATAGQPRQRTRRALVVLQVAVALVLVAGAGLMARSFRLLRDVQPGFDTERSYTFRVSLPAAEYPDAAAIVNLTTSSIDRLVALPGVASAGAISRLPLTEESRRDTAVWIEDRPLTMGQVPNVHQVVYASRGAFRALGIPIVQGRAFGRPDAAHAPLEVIVSRALAKRYWGDAPAVGKRLNLALPFGGPWFTVIGVAGDVRGEGLDQPPDETVYLPLVSAPGPAGVNGGAGPARFAPRQLAFVVRSDAVSRDLTKPVERTFQALAPGVPVYDVRTMGQILERSTSRASFTLDLLEIASLAALLIGAVGVYGIVSYSVSQRSRELAVRMALGAKPGALRRQVLLQAAAMAATGIALGIAATIALARLIAGLLFGVAPTDAATLTAAALVMAAVTLVATWLPARRAASIDIVAALRSDT